MTGSSSHSRVAGSPLRAVKSYREFHLNSGRPRQLKM